MNVSTNDVIAAKKLQELREQQAVIQAYLDGKQIEFRFKTTNKWSNCATPTWAFDSFDYRVKKEPRTVHVIVSKDSKAAWAVFYSWREENAAEHAQRYYDEHYAKCGHYELITFIEKE